MRQLLVIIYKNKYIFIIIGFIALMVNIRFFQAINSAALIVVLTYWVFLAIIYRLSANFFFIGALVLLILSVPPFLLNHILLPEKLNVWAFLFLFLGLLQGLLFDTIYADKKSNTK